MNPTILFVTFGALTCVLEREWYHALWGLGFYRHRTVERRSLAHGRSLDLDLPARVRIATSIAPA